MRKTLVTSSRCGSAIRARALPLLAVLVSLGPILYMFFLLTKGGNNLHADFGLTLGFIDIVRNGGLTPLILFKANYATGHVYLIPSLIQLIVANLFDYNVFVVIYIGFAFNIVRWLFLYDLFTYRDTSELRWAFLPVLALLVFLPSQLPLYSFGFASVQYFLSHLGFVIGLWALIRFPLTWKTIGLMGVSGLVASWSSGIGPLSWPVYLVVLLALKSRQLLYYATWLIASAVSLMPYAYFLLIDTSRNTGIVSQPNLFDFRLMAAEIGWAFFHRDDPGPGILGIVLLITGAGILLAILRSGRHRQLLKQVLPALMILLFSLLVIVQIAAFRAGLGAHRSAQFLTFWTALAGLAYVLGTFEVLGKKHVEFKPGRLSALTRAWCITVFAVIAFFSFLARTGKDYDHFLLERTPASASCLRHYATAPTYCLTFVHRHPYASLPFLYSLGTMAERNHLSVFGANQQWALQGDLILGTVRTSQDHLIWVKGRSAGDIERWDSYERLNLLLPDDAHVIWQVTLPSTMLRAEFRSAVTLESDTPIDSNSEGVAAGISIVNEQGKRTPAYSEMLLPGDHTWHAISIPLTRYAGETIFLEFTTTTLGGGSGLGLGIYRYPVIDLRVEPTQRPDPIEFRPTNTDLSSQFPVRGNEAYRLDLRNEAQWQTSGLTPLPERTEGSGWDWMIDQAQPGFTTIQPLDLCLAHYAYFYIRQVASREAGVADEITLWSEDGRRYVVQLVLVGDEQLHRYTYDIGLLEWPSSLRLTHMTLRVHSAGFLASEGRVHIEEIGFIPGTRSESKCR